MSLLPLSAMTDFQIGDAPVVSIGLDIEHQGSSISLSYARSELPHETIYFGRSPSLSEPADSTDLGGRLCGDTGRVEFRCAVMSREHASLSFGDDGKIYLRDLPACHHGTTITRGNSEMKLDKVQLYQVLDGDKITFGKPVHKGGVIHEPLHATVRLSMTQEKPHTGSGRYRLSSPDLYTDDDFGREVTPPWRKDFGDFTGIMCGFDMPLCSHQPAQSVYSIVDADDDDEDDQSVVEIVPSSVQTSPLSNHSSPSTVTKSPAQAEVIDLTREFSPIHSLYTPPCFEVVEDSEAEDVVSASENAPASVPPPQENVVLPIAAVVELECPQPIRKPDIEHLLNDGADQSRENSNVAPENLQDGPGDEIIRLQKEFGDIKREMQRFRIHRVKAKRRLSLNQTTTEATIQVLARELKELEERLDTSLYSDSQINDDVDMTLSAVADLANDVEDSKIEINDMLTEIRDLRAECERIIKAEVESIESIRKTSELALKRKYTEFQNSDAAVNEEPSPDSYELPANQSGSSADIPTYSTKEGPSPKRRRVLPFFGGATVSQFIFGAIAGSIGTVMALAWADDE